MTFSCYSHSHAESYDMTKVMIETRCTSGKVVLLNTPYDDIRHNSVKIHVLSFKKMNLNRSSAGMLASYSENEQVCCNLNSRPVRFHKISVVI